MSRLHVVSGLVVLAVLLGGSATAQAEDVTMEGSYVWKRGDSDIPGDIKAVFTPAGKNSWDIMFHFEWEGEQRAWAGTATGSLESGELEGMGVEEKGRKREFVFRGNVEKGVFTGEHGALKDGEWNGLGTITFKAP